MTNEHLMHRPEVDVAIDDARQHLRRAQSALRAVGEMEPDRHPLIPMVHALISDWVEELRDGRL